VSGQLDVGEVAFAERHRVHRVSPDTLDLLAHRVGFSARPRLAATPPPRRRLPLVPAAEDGGSGRWSTRRRRRRRAGRRRRRATSERPRRLSSSDNVDDVASRRHRKTGRGNREPEPETADVFRRAETAPVFTSRREKNNASRQPTWRLAVCGNPRRPGQHQTTTARRSLRPVERRSLPLYFQNASIIRRSMLYVTSSRNIPRAGVSASRQQMKSVGDSDELAAATENVVSRMATRRPGMRMMRPGSRLYAPTAVS